MWTIFRLILTVWFDFPVAQRLKGKGKGSEKATDLGSQTTTSTDLEKENISVQSQRSKSPKPSRKGSAKVKRPTPLPLPPARTRPYEQPFFFPSPLASEYEKVMYVRSARDELRRGRGTADSGSAASVVTPARLDKEKESASGASDVDEFGAGAKSRTVQVAPTSAPAGALSFAQASNISTPAGAGTMPHSVNPASARPRPHSMQASATSSPSTLPLYAQAKDGSSTVEERVKGAMCVAEPVTYPEEAYDPAVVITGGSRRSSTDGPMAVVSSTRPEANSRLGWSILKRYGKSR